MSRCNRCGGYSEFGGLCPACKRSNDEQQHRERLARDEEWQQQQRANQEAEDAVRSKIVDALSSRDSDDVLQKLVAIYTGYPGWHAFILSLVHANPLHRELASTLLFSHGSWVDLAYLGQNIDPGAAAFLKSRAPSYGCAEWVEMVAKSEEERRLQAQQNAAQAKKKGCSGCVGQLVLLGIIGFIALLVIGQFNSDGTSGVGSESDLGELKHALLEVEAEIASEREKFQEALGTINRLTNFKRTPVKEGSQAYDQCLEASKIIKEVEAGAPALKEKKAEIEALILKAEK